MNDYILGCSVRGSDYDFRVGEFDDEVWMYRNGRLVCTNNFASDSLIDATHDIALGHIGNYKFGSKFVEAINSEIARVIADTCDEEKEEVWF